MIKHIDPLRKGRDQGGCVIATISGDALVVDCRTCHLTPLPGSHECIGCMVRSISETGGGKRVVLRTGMDIEVSGKAGEVLKEVAALRRWSIPAEVPKGRCKMCPISRSEVMGMTWERFPDRNLDDIRTKLISEVPEMKGCDQCVTSTIRALEQLDEQLDRMEERMGRRSHRWSLGPLHVPPGMIGSSMHSPRS